VNGLTAAKGLRRSVEGAGGAMRISVPALGDAFGRGKLTGRARAGIEQVLRRAGLEVAPSLTDPRNDGWVTLRVADRAAPAASPPAAPAPSPRAAPARASVSAPTRPRRHLQPAPFLAAALAFLVPALLVLTFALPDSGTRPGRADAEQTTSTPSTPPDALLQRADTALLAGDYTAAVRLTREADPTRVPALRQRIAAALTTQARAAQRRRAYVRAIKLARRAARYGRAPGASAIVRQSRAGLDLRREEQRRREAPAGPA
jgi:hypothetical protein